MRYRRTKKTKRQLLSHYVGYCKWCKIQIDSYMSFVIYATKEPSCYGCYKQEAEKDERGDKKEDRIQNS